MLGQKDENGNFRPKYGHFPLHIIHALEYSDTTFIDKHFNKQPQSSFCRVARPRREAVNWDVCQPLILLAA